MNAGRRHMNPELEMKYSLLLITIAVTRISAFLHWFPKLQFPQDNTKRASAMDCIAGELY